jgi:hypothetical protein
VLAFIGVASFQRLVQSSIEDIAYAQRVARLRAFYLDVAPELEPFLLVVREPRFAALLHHETLQPSAWQLTLTAAGMVAVVNSVVIGACAGLAVRELAIGSLVVVLASEQSQGWRLCSCSAATTDGLWTRTAQSASTGPRPSSRHPNGDRRGEP